MATKVNGLIQKVDPGNGTQYSIASTAYGYCETAAATAAKTVDMTGFTLLEGTTVHIRFKERNNVASPTLNINGTGAFPIVQYGTTAVAKDDSTSGWYAGAVVSFTLVVDPSDSTKKYWVRDQGFNTNSTYYYTSIYCTTAAGTAAKVGAISGAQELTAGKYFQVWMLYGNTSQSKLTLNISSQGAKDVYINGTISSSTNYTLPRGCYIVYYDGTNYYFRTDDKLTANITGTAENVRGTIAIANGGTGETTAAAAWTALGGGDSGKHADNYYALASHGTHVSYGTSATAVSTTASAGSATTVSRSDHVHSLPLAASGTRGGIQIGYSESGNNYAVKLSSEKAYVTVPWTNYYHKTGSWDGLTYTATKVGTTDDLAFTIPTGTTSTTVALGDHTHTTSLATDTGTSTVSLTYGGKYKLTAGGTSVIFTMPASDNTNTTYTFTNGTTGNFSVTPSGGSAQTVSIGKPATAGTADKLGSSTLGSSIKPIYLSSGTATECAEMLPVYYDNIDFATTTQLASIRPVKNQTNPVTNTAEYGGILTFPSQTNGGKGYNAQLLITSPSGTSAPHAYIRRMTSTPAWSDWATLLDNSNYTTYTVKKDGTGATGSWGISITGNAATATTASKATAANITTTTNAVAKYSNTTGTFANSGVIIDSSNNLSVPANISATGNLSITGTSTLSGEVYADSITTGNLVVTGGASFTQIPTSQTPDTSSNDNSIATTAFVKNNIGGLSGAMHFKGTTTTEMTDGRTTQAVTIGGSSYTPEAGDVVLYSDSEFVWTGSAWERLGRDSSFKTTQSAVTTATDETSTATRFVHSITQDANGVITVKTRPLPTYNNYSLPTASSSTKGGIKVGSGLTMSGEVMNHSNSVTAQTTQALYPIKIDGQGHISAYGTAITSLPASDVSDWAKASTKPSYALSEITGAEDVQAIEALSGTSGLLKKTAANTWTLDTNNYVTSSGVTSITPGNGLLNGTGTSAITGTGTLNLNYGSSTQAIGTASAGSAKTVSRSDHVHSISLATGDANGQVKIAGTNIDVKGLGSAAYTASSAYAAASHSHYWANIATTSTATYNKTPEMATIKLNGNTSATAASTSNVTLVFDATLQALNFVFA